MSASRVIATPERTALTLLTQSDALIKAVTLFPPWLRAGGARAIKCGLYSDPHFALDF
jgi:hypothetical protein